MNIIYSNNPNPHAIISNIFTDSEISSIAEYTRSLNNNESLWLFADCPVWELLQDKAWEIFDKVYPSLDKITTQERNNILTCSESDSFFRIEVKKLEPGFNHSHPHTDSPWKQFVTVLYIDGQGNGTKLYRSGEAGEKPVKVVPWKINTGYCAIPNEINWHDFDHPATFTEPRTTINLLLANKKWYK